MSVTVSEYATAGSNTPTSMRDGHTEHKEELLGDSRPSKTSERMRHTAKGFEAIGFNEHASMYSHGFRQNDEDKSKKDRRKSGTRGPGGGAGAGKEGALQRPTQGMEKKRTMSFIKKLIGSGSGGVSESGGREKGERV